MELSWYGNSCFKLTSETGSVLMDPYSDLGVKLPSLKADFLTLSQGLEGRELHEVHGTKSSSPKILDWPGEFEVSGIAIEAVEGPDGALFMFSIDGIKVAHLGALQEGLLDSHIEQLGDVDVLLISIGGDTVLNAKAAFDIVERIEPRLVIPMYYTDQLDEFLKLTGKQGLEAQDKYVVKGRSTLPEDIMDFVVLRNLSE